MQFENCNDFLLSLVLSVVFARQSLLEFTFPERSLMEPAGCALTYNSYLQGLSFEASFSTGSREKMNGTVMDEVQDDAWEGSSSCGTEEKISEYSYGHIAASIVLEKRTRKAVEEDTERLYNRVRQLEKEEEKARRRIVDTQQRTSDILVLRQRNQQKLEAKEKRMKDMEGFLKKQRWNGISDLIL